MADESTHNLAWAIRAMRTLVTVERGPDEMSSAVLSYQDTGEDKDKIIKGFEDLSLALLHWLEYEANIAPLDALRSLAVRCSRALPIRVTRAIGTVTWTMPPF
jgi:hypothetical protein